MPTPAYEDMPINPQLLRDPSWLLHKDKKPFYANGKPRSGKLDSAADIAKLVAFDKAITALNAGTYTGLGLAINRGIQFIDLDKCRDPNSGELQPWALTLQNVAIALGAFVEVSISGRGLHIVGCGGELPTHKGNQIELYTRGRYMALGIKVLNTGTDPLPDLAPLLGMMQERLLPAAPRKTALRLVKPSPMLWNTERPQTKKLLKRLNPDMEYPDWVKVGMALHDGSAGSQDGLDLWDEWSQGGEKYGQGVCAKLWAGFKFDGGITMGTLHHMAQAAEVPKALRVTEPKRKPTGPVEDAVERRKEFTFDELMATEHAPIPWLVDGMICPGLTLLAAPPKMGKSYFVLQMGMCVASGTPFLGRQTTKARVSYFDLEEWEEMLKVRAVDIMRGNGITKPDLRFQMEMSGGDVTVLEDLQRHIDEGSKLLIIDLLARVRDELSEDSKKNAYARDYEVLRQFADFVLNRNPGVSIIIVHHTNKGQHEDWQSKISGSQGLAGASHCNMLLANLDMRGLDDEQRKEALKHRRFHLVGKAVAGDEMILKMMDNRGGWEVTDRTADDVRMMSKHAHVLQILREADGEWMTAKQVHEQVEGTLDSVKKMLLRMAKKGEIQSSGSGGAGYRLPNA